MPCGVRYIPLSLSPLTSFSTRLLFVDASWFIVHWVVVDSGHSGQVAPGLRAPATGLVHARRGDGRYRTRCALHGSRVRPLGVAPHRMQRRVRWRGGGVLLTVLSFSADLVRSSVSVFYGKISISHQRHHLVISYCDEC